MYVYHLGAAFNPDIYSDPTDDPHDHYAHDKDVGQRLSGSWHTGFGADLGRTDHRLEKLEDELMHVSVLLLHFQLRLMHIA